MGLPRLTLIIIVDSDYRNQDSDFIMIWNKHFKSMYTGSMVGSGALVFAVMGYVVANMEPDREIGSRVELNPVLLATILGESEKDVRKAIEKLCAPDEESRTDKEEGKRLVRLGQFDYRVVNGAKYAAIRNEEDRKAQVREAQRRFRDKNKKSRKVQDKSGTNGDVSDTGAEVTSQYPSSAPTLCPDCGHPTLSVSPSPTCPNHPQPPVNFD